MHQSSPLCLKSEAKTVQDLRGTFSPQGPEHQKSPEPKCQTPSVNEAKTKGAATSFVGVLSGKQKGHQQH